VRPKCVPLGSTLRRGILITKKPRAQPATLDSLAKLIKKTSASADKNFTALAQEIADIKGDIGAIKVADIKSTMATKADVHAIVRGELAPIRAELNRSATTSTVSRRNSRTSPALRKEID